MRLPRPFSSLIVLAVVPLLSGCLAKTAANIVTAPVRVVSKGVDWTTTSQSEADRNRGRALRKREERLGKLDSEYRRESARCDRGNEEACDRARALYGEIETLRPTVPVGEY